MFAPSSVRSRFSSSTFRLYGSRSAPSTASSRKIWYEDSRHLERSLAAEAVLTHDVLPSSRLDRQPATPVYLDVEITATILRGGATIGSGGAWQPVEQLSPDRRVTEVAAVPDAGGRGDPQRIRDRERRVAVA